MKSSLAILYEYNAAFVNIIYLLILKTSYLLSELINEAKYSEAIL